MPDYSAPVSPCSAPAPVRRLFPFTRAFALATTALLLLLAISPVCRAGSLIFYDEAEDHLGHWTTVDGSSPTLDVSRGMALNNGVIRADLYRPVHGSWTLSFRAIHSTRQRGLWAGVFNADGTEGYGVLWDSASSGTGVVTLRRFDLATEPQWGDTGTAISSTARSGHNPTSSPPMALFELDWDAATRTLSLYVDGVLRAEEFDPNFHGFHRLYLRGNTTSYFDEITLQAAGSVAEIDERFYDLSSMYDYEGDPALHYDETPSFRPQDPRLVLNDDTGRIILPSTIRDGWTLHFDAELGALPNKLWLSLHPAYTTSGGTGGYSVVWSAADGSTESVSIVKNRGSTDATVLSGPIPSNYDPDGGDMVHFQLNWDSPTQTLSLWAGRNLLGQASDTTYDEFNSLTLGTKGEAFFDNVVLLVNSPPSPTVIADAYNFVTDGGAVGDGVTDNGPLLAAAIAAASAQGRALYVPPGVYAYTGSHDLQGVRMFGNGYSSVLRALDEYDRMLRVSGDGGTLGNLRLIADYDPSELDTTPASAAVSVYQASNFVVSGLHIDGASSAGIIVHSDSPSHGAITDCTLDDTGSNNLHLTSGTHDVAVVNNRFGTTVHYAPLAIVSYANQAVNCHDILVTHNDFFGSDLGITSFGGADLTFSYNRLRNIYRQAISAGSEPGTEGADAIAIDIVGNEVTDSLSWHQKFWSAGDFGVIQVSSIQGLQISGNLAATVTQCAIQIQSCTDVTVDHNVLFPGSETGVEVRGSAADLAIYDNTFPFMPYSAIRVEGMSGAAGYLTIDSNTFGESMIDESPTELDVVYIEATDLNRPWSSGSTWSSVQASNNTWTDPHAGETDLFMEIHFPGAVVSGNNPTTGIWVGP